MEKTQSWLWPNRSIGKRESRLLRDEHNALVNDYVRLLDALRECITKPDAYAFGGVGYQEAAERMARRLHAINDTAGAAIAQATR